MSPEKEEKSSGISIQTLLISSAAAVAAAIIVPMFWERGSLLATAITPIIVALVSEGLNRPAKVITQVTPRVTRRSATGAAVRAEQPTRRRRARRRPRAGVGARGRSVRPADAREAPAPRVVEARRHHRPAGGGDRRRRGHRLRTRDLRPLGQRLGPLDQRVRRLREPARRRRRRRPRRSETETAEPEETTAPEETATAAPTPTVTAAPSPLSATPTPAARHRRPTPTP